MAKQTSDKMRRLQRKLIPVNIVVMVLSLVAVLSLVFMPLVQIDVGKLTDLIPMGESGEGGEPTEGFDMSKIMESLDGTSVTITTYFLAQTAFSETAADDLIDTVVDFIVDAADAVIMDIALPMLAESFEFEDNNVDIGLLDDGETQALFEKLDELGTTENYEQTIDEFVELFLTSFELKDIANEQDIEHIKDTLGEFYENTCEYNDGNFSLEAALCVTISLVMGGQEENPAVYTNYRDLVGSFLESGEILGGMSELMDGLSEAMGYVRYVVYALFFLAGVWLILFLFAFLHLLAKNKRFTMWYVKLFGAILCIIFWLIPTVAPMVLPELASVLALDAEMITMVTGVCAAYSSFAWISGLCYLLLWLVSIFWAFPIKHKIRKLKRQGDVPESYEYPAENPYED